MLRNRSADAQEIVSLLSEFDWIKLENQSASLLYVALRHPKMADDLPEDFDVIVLGTGKY